LESIPTLKDVLEAKARISPYITRTSLHKHLALDKLIGADTYVKHENHQILGAFKVRGGINLLSQMSPDQLKRGVSTASSGNHGQSIAFAARLFGTEAHIAVPEGANPGKVSSMRNLGAEVIHYGEHFGISDEYIQAVSQELGYRYINAVTEPILYAGVGTYTLEILEDLPDIEVIIVPVGGGSGACGTCIVAKSINPNIKVIGVQSESAPAAFNSWKSGHLEEAQMTSVAEGLATNKGYDPAQPILRKLLDDFILVSDDEMEDSVYIYLEQTRNLVEHAGAASLAAAIKLKDTLKGKKIALIASGGNLSMEHLRKILATRGR
jgi:threonine dehydratase